MSKGLTILAVVANLVVSFYAGRRSFGALAPYTFDEVVAVYDVCDAGFFVGGCKGCSGCKEYEYPAGGCTYFKDTFCTLCEEIKNCPQENIRCTQKDDERCLECDPGFWGTDCKPCNICVAGEFELKKCTQVQNTECGTCSQCKDDQFTEVACTYFGDTQCKDCLHCSPFAEAGELAMGFTSTKCEIDVNDSFDMRGARALEYPESVYTVGLDTVCTPCTEPLHDGVKGEPDEMVTELCTEWADTEIKQCTLCPCRNRPTCEYMTEYCVPGNALSEYGVDVQCADCTKIRGGQQLFPDADGEAPWIEEEKQAFKSGVEWEVFRCGGTSDALFKECSICMEGEYEEKPCTQTSDTICPVCSLDIVYGMLEYCITIDLRCTTFQDTKCLECEPGWWGESCCYHQYFGSCGTMSTRERIPRRLGYEGETNEEFLAFALMLCDEFPDCMAYEVEDGGTTLFEGGLNSFEGKTAAVYFKSAFSQDDSGGISDATEGGARVASGNALRGRNQSYRGEDPTYDCYSNVCRQNAAFPNAYQPDVEIKDDVVFTMASELEGSQYQAGAMTRRASEGFAGGSSAASRTEFRRMMEKAGDSEGLQQLSEREAYIAKFAGN